MRRAGGDTVCVVFEGDGIGGECVLLGVCDWKVERLQASDTEGEEFTSWQCCESGKRKSRRHQRVDEGGRGGRLVNVTKTSWSRASRHRTLRVQWVEPMVAGQVGHVRGPGG